MLDAICLALFGSYPRVSERRSDYVLDSSGESLPSWNPGNILQRGKGRGRAEVDFVATDGRAYRATWEIHRALGRANGLLQDPTRTLLCIDDGSMCAKTVRTVDAKIPELTGLNFDQFQRTVLLSQGQFDRFLEAKDSERGELLEKITGPEVYAQISKLLFEHCKSLRVDLENLRVKQQMLRVLSDEERAAFELRRGELEEQISNYQAAEQQIQQQLQFRTAVRQARVDLKRAKDELSEAQTASTDSQPTRDLIAWVELVNPLRSLHNESDRMRNRIPSLKASTIRPKLSWDPRRLTNPLQRTS